ncbi:MAG: PEGA domain-containing protein [Candidatus Omnitrophica bacterium]|nr:PEGA domain-containing protein [Candidatus Omnitrophota bacterium]
MFYLSVAVFVTGLPFILSFALGYKLDSRTLKFTKTGLISIRTQPQGADIYLEGKLLGQKTPVTIGELLPGLYNLRVELENYYPWVAQVNVQPRKVSRFEKIILFPLRPLVKQLNKERISWAWVDRENSRIYYLNRQENIVYESNLEGDNFQEIARLPGDFTFPIRELKVSPDQEKILLYNKHQIAIVYLQPENGLAYTEPPLILEYPQRLITHVFWHSDSYHFILVTDRKIEAGEAKPGSGMVSLMNLNKKTGSVFYDVNKDTLYFLDSQVAPDGLLYENAYKLELNSRFYPFQELIKFRQNAKPE